MSDAAAISRPTNCSYANAMIGYEHPLAGQIEKALKLFPRAVEIEPQSLLAAWGIGQTLAAASAWGEACEWFRRAVDREGILDVKGTLIQHHQATGVGERQRFQQHRMHHGEQCRVGTNAQGHDRNRHDREAGVRARVRAA